MDDFLDRNPYVIESVMPLSGGLMDVWIRFDDPVPTDEWSDGVCSVGLEGGTEFITGVHWRIHLEQASVVALSPRWGDFSCLGPGQ